MGGGDNFEVQAQRFTSNGYCRSAIRAYDYNATYLAFGDLQVMPRMAAPQADIDANQVKLDAAVDAFLKDTKVDKIDLVGHSFGTATSAIYLSDPAHAAKIAHYAQAAGAGLPEPVPQVNLSSDGDFVAGHPKKVAAAQADGGPEPLNPDIGYIDHVGVLTCKEAFAAMYELFNGSPPKATDVVAEDHIVVSGFYKNFSDNTPHPGVKIGIYEVDEATGKRLRDKADFEFTTADDGAWGPFVAKKDARYEFY
jgi:pimeloyl-ACP methyl ester carboxylesterase